MTTHLDIIAENTPEAIRSGIASRQRARFEARQEAESRSRQRAEAEAQKKAEVEACKKVEAEAKAAQDRAQLKPYTLAQIVKDSEKLPRVNCRVSFHPSPVILDFGNEESWVANRGNFATIGLGLDLIANLGAGMESGKWSRGDLATTLQSWAYAGKVLASYGPAAPCRAPTLGAFMDFYGLTFVAIESPESLLDKAVESEMRANFCAKFRS